MIINQFHLFVNQQIEQVLILAKFEGKLNIFYNP